MKLKKEIEEVVTELIDNDINEIIRNEHVFHDVETDENARERTLNNVISRINKKRNNRRYFFSGVAAAMVLLLFVPTLFYLKKGPENDLRFHEIAVKNGEKLIVALSDGTKVWLNAGTSFIYPEQFAGKRRDVYITGEGFFEVAKNPAKPFFVNIGELAVKVVGTSFNVNAYPDDDNVTVWLKEGKIEIDLPGSDYSDFVMSPGEVTVYSKSQNQYSLIAEDRCEVLSSWWEDEVKFSNTPLGEVLVALERLYDVRFTVMDEKILAYTYTFSSNRESVEDVLDKIKTITPVLIEENGPGEYILKGRKY